MLHTLLLILFLFSCVVLITLILMQAGRGEGLAGVFGGDNMQQMLGTQAPDILEKVTWGAVSLFFVLTVVLSIFTSKQSNSLVDSIAIQQPVQQQQPLQKQKKIPANVKTAIPVSKDTIPDKSKGQVPAGSIQVDTTTPENN